MANTLQSKKRVRQNETKRLHNKAAKSAVRTQVRKFKEAVAAGERERAEQELQRVYRQLDKAAKTNLLHKNTVNRKKARLTRELAALGSG